MNDKIFILNQSGELSELRESKYNSEELLQTLLSDYTELLAGSQIDEINPRNWILVSREIGIPDKQDARNRWSLDHLFIDQDGIPTLVEVKRSTDTRIRREVIGQILDYAANAVSYWTIEQLINTFENNCKSNNLDPNEEINKLINEDYSITEYWELVSTNLKAGKIRMLIVADSIPFELKSIIEFLNTQMSPAEILGVEIKQFKNEKLKTLVPKVIGKSAKSDSLKKVRTVNSTSIDYDEYWKVYEEHSGRERMKIAKEIIESIKDRKDYYYFGGSGIEHGIGHSILPSTYAKFDGKKKKIYIVSLWTNGNVELQLQHLKGRGFFDLEKNQKLFIDKLNKIDGLEIGHDKVFKRPSFHIDVLKDNGNRNIFIEILNWAYDKADIKNEI